MILLMFELLILASGFNIITLFVVLFYKKQIPVPNANRLFAFMLFFMTLYSFSITVQFFSVTYRINGLLINYIHFENLLFLLITPTLYFFIRAILCNCFKIFNGKLVFHLLPFIPFLLYSIFFLELKPLSRVNILIENYTSNSSIYIILNSLLYLQVIIYLLLSLNLINKQLKKSRFISYNNIQYDIRWLRRYLIVNIVYTFISVPLYIYFRNEFCKIIITQVGMELQFIYFFFRWTLNIEGTLFKIHDIKNVREIESDKSTNQLDVLARYMNEDKLYLNEKCTIQFVAEKTGISVHQLSSLLNCVLNKSFNDYLNEFRVNEAKILLSNTDNKSTTIETIGLDCGFGSKSTFYRVFKKHTNQTPLEYLKHNNIKSDV